ncbi:FadR/GntR family transcriptional regulator [Sediminicurvatus halobius]|uniref:FadR family transcriptional regulator n=1 Tax=Sediminicurvatus halobius TaxID=2182432 RepID=A0A2U2MXA8_9GAMM|nr:FCD domain-containing protein [Spiribacter halobius]PWG61501.1 FadR family transcriptional regulator [Spiribacter halobius]UEX77959.1 FCD domain-containing protein [Spiribacter halobius]
MDNGNREGDSLFRRLTEEIIAKLKADTHGRVRLPTERDLARQLRVQRHTLRERLAALESLGLIQRVQGSGTYLVLPQSQFVQMYFEVALKLGYISVEELMRAQEMIEREIAYSAALHASTDEVDAMNRYLERTRSAEGEGVVDAHHGFHTALARASHNAVIVLLVDGLASVLRHVLERRVENVRQVPGAEERVRETYGAILSAIRYRDPEEARMAMDEHFRVWRRESAKVTTLHLDEG